VVADLEMEQIEEVRNVWQFYRDRRSETYDTLAEIAPHRDLRTTESLVKAKRE
jgi:hypothetical protein